MLSFSPDYVLLHHSFPAAIAVSAVNLYLSSASHNFQYSLVLPTVISSFDISLSNSASSVLDFSFSLLSSVSIRLNSTSRFNFSLYTTNFMFSFFLFFCSLAGVSLSMFTVKTFLAVFDLYRILIQLH